jgi:hypothetical protein
MEYGRRLTSYGLRDASGPTGRVATPAQMRRIKHKNWNRPYRPPEPEPVVTRPAEPVAAIVDEVQAVPFEPEKRAWRIRDLLVTGAGWRHR